MRNQQFLSVNYNQSNKMGNSESHPQKLKMLDKQNWIQAGEDEQQALFSNVNPYRRRLLSNLSSQQLIQQYQINFISQQDYSCYIKQLMLRVGQQSPVYIYPIHSFLSENKYQICTTVYSGLLYIQKVDLRLKQINDIPFADLIYMYKATLQGFKLLYQRVGYFDIVEEMIFIDRRGGVKVWMNANLSKNYPNFQKNDALTNKSKATSESMYGSQSEMIKDLILLIQKNFDQNQQLDSLLFSQYLEQKHILQRLSFSDSLEQFQFYLSQNNLYCALYMKSIPQLFAPSQPHTNQQNRYQQSHVNQITTTHLNQMKEKWRPMQMIHQEERMRGGRNSLSTNTLKKHDSVQQNRFYNHQLNKPFNELDKSQHSSKSRNYQVETDHLQRSSHSHLPVMQSKMTTTNFNPNHYTSNFPTLISYPPLPQSNHQNQPYHPNYPNHRQHINYPNYINHPYPNQSRLISASRNFPITYTSPSINSSSQSFNPSSSNYHPYALSRQPFTPRCQFMQTPKIKFSDMSTPIVQANHIGNHISQQMKVSPEKSMHIDKKSMHSDAYHKQGNVNLTATQQIDKDKLQNSKINYYSNTKAYQLDEEIANDLQIFLGLKVN